MKEAKNMKDVLDFLQASAGNREEKTTKDVHQHSTEMMLKLTLELAELKALLKIECGDLEVILNSHLMVKSLRKLVDKNEELEANNKKLLFLTKDFLNIEEKDDT